MPNVAFPDSLRARVTDRYSSAGAVGTTVSVLGGVEQVASEIAPPL